MRVALCTNILTPYRVPVYRALAATPGWKLRVFVDADTEFDRSWRVSAGDLEVETLHSPGLRWRSRTRGPLSVEQVTTRHVPLALPGALRRFAPDVVVSGELGVRSVLASLYCRTTGTPLVLWSYHSRVSATAAGPPRRALRRLLLRRAQAVVGMGTQAREVLAELGVPRGRLFDAPNAHDRDGLRAALAGADAEGLRRALCEGTGRPHIALVAGRLVPAKGIRPLLAAWSRLPAVLRSRWTLLFLGDGPLVDLVRDAAERRMPGEVAWLPAVPPAQVPAYYAASDLLVFPTLAEPWGLVVNEAFACGRPVLCSSLAGCADDLLRPGTNGWLCDPTDVESLAASLHDALTDGDRPRLGEGARRTAERFGPEQMADGLRRAVMHAHTVR